MGFILSYFPLSFTKTAEGQLLVAGETAEIQVKAQYDTLRGMRTLASGGGTATSVAGEFTVTTSAASGGFGVVFSDRQIISRAAQGSSCRFTARFPVGAVGNDQFAGPASALDSIQFGRQGGVFGVVYGSGGTVIVEELQVTTAATGGENATVTVDGTGYTVALTGGGTVQDDAFEIAASLTSQVALYNFSQNDDTVVARSILAIAETGSFAFSSSTAAGTWTQISDGLPSTTVFTPQTSWSEDTLTTLDPTKLNYFTVQWDGGISYYVQDDEGVDVLVHQHVHANSTTGPLFSVAAFRMSWGSTNQGGNTTDIATYGTEAAAFIEGLVTHTEEGRSFSNTQAITTTSQTNVLTIKCRDVFGTNVNLGRITLSNVTVSNEANKTAIVEIRKNVTAAGNTDYSYIDKSNSIAETDTTSTTVSLGELLASFPVAPNGGAADIDLSTFGSLLLPTEALTISMAPISGAGGDMSASILWDEEL